MAVIMLLYIHACAVLALACTGQTGFNAGIVFVVFHNSIFLKKYSQLFPGIISPVWRINFDMFLFLSFQSFHPLR
jgi:hypothetical protein